MTVPKGTYDLVIAHAERHQLPVAPRAVTRVTYVVITGEHSGELLYGALADTPRAAWIWEDALGNITPENILGVRVRGDVDVDEWQGIPRNRVGPLYSPVPRVIVNYGVRYVREDDLR